MPSFNNICLKTEIPGISDQVYHAFNFFDQKNSCIFYNTSQNFHVNNFRPIRKDHVIAFSCPYRPSYKTTKHIDQSSVWGRIFPIKDISILNKHTKSSCNDLSRYG